MHTNSFQFSEDQRRIIFASGNDIILSSSCKENGIMPKALIRTLSPQGNSIDSKELYYTSGNFTEQKRTMLGNIEEWRCKCLKLYCNNCPSIISCLLEIRFTHLKDLNISTNDVVSFENLCRIYMPNMEYLWLWINPVRSCRSLIKGNWPKLRTLDLKQTKILQFQQLSGLQAPQMKRFDLSNSHNNASVNGLFKFQSTQLESLQIKDFTSCCWQKIQKIKTHKKGKTSNQTN